MSLPDEIVRLVDRTKIRHAVRDARAAARGPHWFGSPLKRDELRLNRFGIPKSAYF